MGEQMMDKKDGECMGLGPHLCPQAFQELPPWVSASRRSLGGPGKHERGEGPGGESKAMEGPTGSAQDPAGPWLWCEGGCCKPPPILVLTSLLKCGVHAHVPPCSKGGWGSSTVPGTPRVVDTVAAPCLGHNAPIHHPGLSPPPQRTRVP